jgi:2-phosphoglycerate kinase
MKNLKHMIISIVTEKKTFDKDQHSFMIKISEQNRHRKKFLQHNGGHL